MILCYAKSLQLCPTLCDPIDGSLPGSPVPGILQARTLEWVAISFSNAWKWKVKVKLSSRVQLLATPWTAAYQAPPSMGFSRLEYWSGVPLPSPAQPYRKQMEGCQYLTWICRIKIRYQLPCLIRYLRDLAEACHLGWTTQKHGQEELPYATSKERWLHGRRRAERTSLKVRRVGCEEIPLVQGKEQRLNFLEQPWRETPRPG